MGLEGRGLVQQVDDKRLYHRNQKRLLAVCDGDVSPRSDLVDRPDLQQLGVVLAEQAQIDLRVAVSLEVEAGACIDALELGVLIQ